MTTKSENLAVRIHALIQESIVVPDFGGYTKVSLKKVESNGASVHIILEVQIELFADKESE